MYVYFISLKNMCKEFTFTVAILDPNTTEEKKSDWGTVRTC